MASYLSRRRRLVSDVFATQPLREEEDDLLEGARLTEEQKMVLLDEVGEKATYSQLVAKLREKFASIHDRERELLPVEVSYLVAKRMRIDATLSPSILDLRMNPQNLVNEMRYNKGKIYSQQFALMKPRRKQVWEKKEKLRELKAMREVQRGVQSLQRKLSRRRGEKNRSTPHDPAADGHGLGTGVAASATSTKLSTRPVLQENILGDPSLDIEVSRLLEDPRIEAVWRSLQAPQEGADELRPDSAESKAGRGGSFMGGSMMKRRSMGSSMVHSQPVGLARNRTSRALEALGHASPDPQIVQDALRSLQGDEPLDLLEFTSIVAVFNRQRRLQLREHFRALDTDGSGTISAREFRHLLWDMGFSVTPEHVQEYLNQADTDNSGEVDFAEFEHACQLVHQRHGFSLKEVEEFEKLFDRYDTNGSGEMDAEELASAMGWFGSPTTTAQAAAIIQRFDDDGNGVLCKPEFLMVMRNRLEEEISEMRSLFGEFDRDRSGTMDLGEIQELFLKCGYTISKEVVHDNIKVIIGNNNAQYNRLGEFTGELMFEDVLRLWHLTRQREGFSEKEIAELEEVFTRHDQSEQGQLREFELGHALDWLGYPLSKQRRRQLWCRVDVDKTETIERGEFLKLVRLLREEEIAEAKAVLQEHTDRVKYNKSGGPRSHLPESLLKAMLVKLGYAPPQWVINQALQHSADVSGDGMVDLQGILGVLRFIREKQVVKLRQSAGLTDQLASKIRGKFGLRLEAGKQIDPAELEKFMYELFPSAKHSKEQQETIGTIVRQHTQGNGIKDITEAFWVVRTYSDARDEEAWRREQKAAADAGFMNVQVAQFREAFVQADANGDGNLSHVELTSVFQEMLSMKLYQVEILEREFVSMGDKKDCIEFADFLHLMRAILDAGKEAEAQEQAAAGVAAAAAAAKASEAAAGRTGSAPAPASA